MQPTGVGFTDVLLRFGFAFVVTLAAARARRSTWIILAAAASVLSPGGFWFVTAVAGLALAIAAAFLPRRRIIGAIVAALAVPALVRAEPFGFTGASALLVWAVVLPVLVSGYRVASRRSRERMHKVATGLVLVALLGSIIFALAAWIAYGDLSAGSKAAKNGLSELRSGKGSQGAVDLAHASDSLASAEDVLGSWWTAPAHLVPFVSQQLEALSVASQQGHDIAAAGSTVAAKADYHQSSTCRGRST